MYAEYLSGRVAMVTGGGTGIGRAVAISGAREGAVVAVNYFHSRIEAEATVAEIIKDGGTAMAVQADVADLSQVNEMFVRVKQELGPVSILINNAGKTRFIDYKNLDEITDDIWDAIQDINVKGAFYCSRAAFRHMEPMESGCIVNIASIAGLTGRGSSIPYAVSKAGMIGLTKSMAIAMAPHVRVNAVAPGLVDTRWTDGQDEFKKTSILQTPMGRNATADDVAEVVLSLTAAAGFVTGQILTIDGGRTL